VAGSVGRFSGSVGKCRDLVGGPVGFLSFSKNDDDDGVWPKAKKARCWARRLTIRGLSCG
jgi:hypothetical protein